MSLEERSQVPTLEYWEVLINNLSKRLKEAGLRHITPENILQAIILLKESESNWEWITDVYDDYFTEEELTELLLNFDFTCLELTVETDQECIPESYRFHRKVRIKSNGAVWVIHKYDADPFPSSPHAHNLDSNIKLDLSNGNCYLKKELKFNIGKKQLEKIREKAKAKGFKIPELNI